MIASDILRKLQKEREEWRRMGKGVETTWAMRGIDIARRIITDMAQAEFARYNDPRLHVSWRLSGMLHKAICKAYDELKRRDYKTALETLKAAKEAGYSKDFLQVPPELDPANDKSIDKDEIL